MWNYIVVMVGVEFALAIVNILLKKALEGGMNHFIIVIYRQTISTIFLAPFAYLWERNSWKNLTLWLMGQIFLCALIGMTLTQYFFLVGLDYTSATFSCAFINVVPVLTFVVALPLGMEKVNMKSHGGKAKVLGTLICAVGALVLTLYKGVPLINSQHNVLNNKKSRNWVIGSLFLFGGSLAWSSWFLIQAKVGKNYPYRYSSTSIMSFFCAVQSIVIYLFMDRNISKWILKGEWQISSVVFGGIVGSGVCYAVMSWCVERRGPVFTSAFCPLIQIFAAIFDVVLLHNEIYLGSILGSIVVVVGMYILLWGKNSDEEAWKHVIGTINK